jgi:hypothetical protein
MPPTKGSYEVHNVAMVFPAKYKQEKTDAALPFEAYVDEEVPLSEIRFVIGTEKRLLTFFEIKDIYNTAQRLDKGQAQADHKVIELTEAIEKIPRVKTRIRAATGQKKLSEIQIDESTALKAQMQAARRAAREAYAAGKSAGTKAAKDKATARYQKAVRDYKEKRKEYIDNHKQRTYLNKTIAYFKTVVKKLNNPEKYKIPEEEAAPLRKLFEGIDLTKLSQKKKLQLSATMRHLEKNPNMELPDRVLEQLERLEKVPLRDMTTEDVQAVEQMVRHYMHLANLKKKIIRKRKLVWLGQTVQESVGEMKNLDHVAGEIISSARGVKEKIKDKASFFKDLFGLWSMHYDLLTESIAGPESIVHDILYRQVKDGIRKMKEYRSKTFREFAEAASSIADQYGIKDIKKWLDETIVKTPVTDKRTNKKVTVAFTRGEVMSLYRHSRLDDNRTALLKGGFGLRGAKYRNRVYLFDSEESLNQVVGFLSRPELLIAGETVDRMLDNQGQLISGVYRLKNGIEMERVGLYWRKDVVPTERREIGEEESSFLERFREKYTRVTVPKGFTRGRVESKKAILIGSFDSELSKSIHDAAAYIGLEIPVSNASQLLYDPTFRNEFEDRYGERYWRALDKGLRDIVGEKDLYDELEDALLKYRSNLSAAVLGLNPAVMLKQVVSLPLFSVYVKPQYLMKAVVNGAFPHSKAEERHKQWSPEYLERVESGYSRDVAEVFQSVSTHRKLLGGKKKFKERMMSGIQWFDRAAVVPGMEGAVMQVLDEIEKGELSESVKVALSIRNEDITGLSVADKMRVAYRYADFVVERTQPMFSPEHRSTLSRGNAVVKMFTMFSSFTNQAQNLIVRTAKEGKRTGNYKPFVTAMFVLLVLNPMAVMFIDSMRDKLYGRDNDDDPRKGWVANWFKSVAGYIYFVRDLAQKAISGYDIETPATKWLNDFAEAISYGIAAVLNLDDEAKRDKYIVKFADNALETALTYAGIPWSTPKKLAVAGYEKLEESGSKY